MGRLFEHHATLGDTKVGYGLKPEGGTWYVRFIGENGGRKKRSLELAVPDDKAPKKEQNANLEAAHTKAKEVIAQAFKAPIPADKKATWDEAIKKWEGAWASSGNRQTTFAAYLKDVNLVRNFFSAVDGPADIDESMAQTWLTEYTLGKDKRRRYEKEKAKKHSAHNVRARLGSLRAIWGKWFRDKLKIVTSNPFENLTPPKADKKEIRYMTDEQFAELLAWTGTAFPGWDMPVLFLRLKDATGCRLADICGLESRTFRDECVTFPAGLLKGREERIVPLPDEGETAGLYPALVAYCKGKRYLWENYPTELKAVLEKKRVPVHQLMLQFDPKRMYDWIETVFSAYNKRPLKEGEVPGQRERITTHMIRKRAFTKGHAAGISIDTLGLMYGCNPLTAKDHYVQIDKAKVAKSGFAAMRKAQADKEQANIPARPQFGHNSANTAPTDATEKR